MGNRRCTHLVAGFRQDRLTLILRIPGRGNGYAHWVCKCSCGKETTVGEPKLASRHTKSCGCYKSEVASATSARVKRTHGATVGGAGTPEYHAWASMRQRCLNPKTKNYARYGARGITVCHRWRDSFENFLDDMGVRPSPKHSIDRINNDGNYEPGNCRWAVSCVQASNRSTTIQLAAFGETMTLRAWSVDPRCVVEYKVLVKRVKAGWAPTRALTERLHAGGFRASTGSHVWTGKVDES